MLIGNLNPAILQPKWLADNNVVQHGEAEIGLAAFAPTGIAQPRFKLHGFSWIPALNRLQVDAESPNVDPGSFVASILELLPHTPVQGVGNNFHFEVGELGERLTPLLRCHLADALSSEEHAGLGLGFTIKLSHKESAVLSLTVEASPKVREVRFNFHRDVKDTAQAGLAASQWQSDREEANRMMKRIEGLAR